MGKQGENCGKRKEWEISDTEFCLRSVKHPPRNPIPGGRPGGRRGSEASEREHFQDTLCLPILS